MLCEKCWNIGWNNVEDCLKDELIRWNKLKFISEIDVCWIFGMYIIIINTKLVEIYKLTEVEIRWNMLK